MKKPEFTGKLDFSIDGVSADKAKRHWREVLSGDILRESDTVSHISCYCPELFSLLV